MIHVKTLEKDYRSYIIYMRSDQDIVTLLKEN